MQTRATNELDEDESHLWDILDSEEGTEYSKLMAILELSTQFLPAANRFAELQTPSEKPKRKSQGYNEIDNIDSIDDDLELDISGPLKIQTSGRTGRRGRPSTRDKSSRKSPKTPSSSQTPSQHRYSQKKPPIYE